MHLPFQKVKRSIVWGRYQTGTIDIFSFIQTAQTLFYLTNLYSAKKKQLPHLFNVECCKLHDRGSLKFFRGMLLNANGHPDGFVFFEADCQKRGLNFSWWRIRPPQKLWYCSNFIVFSFNYDNLTLKLHQEKHSYPDERWLFIGRFKVESVLGMSVALEASKKVSKPIKSLIRCKTIKIDI